MSKLKKLVQQKLLENEFENKPKVRDGIQAAYQPLLDEIEYLEKKMRTCEFQADQLQAKLRYLQKNYYDDMIIIDDTYKGYDGEIFPWKSSNEYTRNQYVYWDIPMKSLHVSDVAIEQVAIRKSGYEKQIKILDSICKRLKTLDELYFNLQMRSELRHKHGQDVWVNSTINTSL